MERSDPDKCFMGKIHQWLVGVGEKSRMRVGFPLGWQAQGDPCQPNRRRKSTNMGGQENVASQKTNGPRHRKPRIGWLGLHGWERGATILSRSLTLKRNNRAVTRQSVGLKECCLSQGKGTSGGWVVASADVEGEAEGARSWSEIIAEVGWN